MPSDFSHRPGELHGHHTAAASGSPFPPPEQPEQLPCPRCDSTNTKFCYYNNYNFSQPRHFCKSCRRYWTRGGSLRDIPVGGGTRKNSRRSRHASSTGPATTSSSAPVLQPHLHASAPFPGSNVGGLSADETLRPPPCGSFTSLLTTQAPAGFLALGGLGLGIDDDNMAFGLNRGAATWAFPGLVDGGVGSSESSLNDHSGASFGMSGAWQIDTGVDGGGDCFSWPELAISTPGNGT